jgi:pectin methylesterase-like acyl-CoA thioesterase
VHSKSEAGKAKSSAGKDSSGSRTPANATRQGGKMKRSVVVAVAVLTSALSLYADNMERAADMTGLLCSSKCVTRNAGHAACDQGCTDKNGEVVLVDDHGKVYKIANQDKVMSQTGKKVKMKCRSVKGEQDTMYVDSVSLYGGGG